MTYPNIVLPILSEHKTKPLDLQQQSLCWNSSSGANELHCGHYHIHSKNRGTGAACLELWERLVPELKKCLLLCGFCSLLWHGEELTCLKPLQVHQGGTDWKPPEAKLCLCRPSISQCFLSSSISQGSESQLPLVSFRAWTVPY